MTTYKQMISDLPDLTQPLSRKRARAGVTSLFPKRRREIRQNTRIVYPPALSTAADMTTEIVRNELKNVGKQLVYAAMEKNSGFGKAAGREGGTGKKRGDSRPSQDLSGGHGETARPATAGGTAGGKIRSSGPVLIFVKKNILTFLQVKSDVIKKW